MDAFQDILRDPIVDLGLNHSAIEAYLLRTGLWTQRPYNGVENTHYILSPCAYRLSSGEQDDLRQLAIRTFAALRRTNERIIECARATKPDRAQARLAKIAKVSSRSLAPPADGLPVPPVLKVDLMRHTDGRYLIAEVDAYNPRGFGYLALLEGMVPEGASGFPGIQRLASMMREAEMSPDAEWFIVISDFERYYDRAFRIFASAMTQHGVRTRIVWDSELYSMRSLFDSMTHAVIIPESLDKYPDVRDRLLSKYRSGELTLFYPPVAYLGSKALLPFLAQERKMPRYLPRCGLVSKTEDPIPRLESDLVLKGTVSSGMKQVVFSDLEPKRFLQTFRAARATRLPGWIMQEQVPQRRSPVVVFNRNGEAGVLSYYFRLTAYITQDGVLGAGVTGREDKRVHGAPDCIQLPCILA
jgi:hypothetical protein